MLIIKELNNGQEGQGYNMIGCESEPPSNEEKDCYSSTQDQQLSTPQTKGLTLESIEAAIQHGSDEDFQEMLRPLSEVLTLHAEHKLFGSKVLHYRLMKCYYRHFKAMSEDNLHDQGQVIFLLSLMAELARRRERTKLPFTKNILLAMLSIDRGTLKSSPYTCQIIRILAVILENLSRQGRMARKLGVENEVMDGLLLLTSRVDEIFTLRILIRAIQQLGGQFTREQLESSGALPGLAENFGEEFALKVKIMLRHAGVRKEREAGPKTLKDLIGKL